MPRRSANQSSLHNERGNALVLALVATVIMTLAGYFINQMSLTTESQLRRTRIKNELQVRFARVMTWLGNTPAATSVQQSLQQIVPNVIQVVQRGSSECVAESMSPSDWNQQDWILCLKIDEESSQEVHGHLHMISKDKVAMLPMKVDFVRTLQPSGVFRCPTHGDLLYVMSGFNPVTNTPNCTPVQKDRTCGPNQFLRMRMPDMRIECADLPTNLQGCEGSNKYIESYSWDGHRMNFVCADKINPFLVWPNAN